MQPARTNALNTVSITRSDADKLTLYYEGVDVTCSNVSVAYDDQLWQWNGAWLHRLRL